MSEIVNAKIENTILGTMDYGYMSFVINLSFGSSHQGFGTYDLRFFGIELIENILSVVGVDSWEELKGKVIRVEKSGWSSPITRIGNLLEDDWLDIAKLIEKIEKKEKLIDAIKEPKD